MWSLFLYYLVYVLSVPRFTIDSPTKSENYFSIVPDSMQKNCLLLLSLSLLSDLYFVLSSWEEDGFGLAGYHEGNSKDGGDKGEEVLPPDSVVEALDGVGSSSDWVDKVDGESNEEEADEELNNGILDNLDIFLGVSVDDMWEFF